MLRARRRVALTAVALASSLLLAACGGSGSNGGAGDGKTLTLWHYESPDSAMGTAWNEAIKEFKAPIRE